MRDRLRQLRSWRAGDRRRQAAAAGVAALLLLAVIVGALAAAGVFSGGPQKAVLDVAASPTPTATVAPSPTPPARVVPVRSARVYYLDWAAELDAVYVHWGWAKSSGAADVPSAIARLELRHLDGFFLSEPSFFRAPDRAGPHDGIADTGAP